MTTDLKRKLNVTANPEHSKRHRLGEGKVEEKITTLVDTVVSASPLGNLVVIVQGENENPYVTLQNALSYLNANLTINKNENTREEFDLQINGVEYARGTFQNIQLAKRSLAEETLEKLKNMCFFIEKKRDYVNVTKENLQTSSSSKGSSNSTSLQTNSIAHKIMMKMGWAGGGLGAQEQGNLDSVTVYENVNRQGLGSSNLMKEITKKLESFSKSSDLLNLVFNSDFTKEERAMIHRVARKFNLKSKSAGSESRRLTVSKKITRIDIVRELLRIGGEDGLYKLHIPEKFFHLWA